MQGAEALFAKWGMVCRHMAPPLSEIDGGAIPLAPALWKSDPVLCQGRKEELRKLEEGFEHQTEAGCLLVRLFMV